MQKLAEHQDLCENFSDVFEIVKRSTENTLKRRRTDLMLCLARLPDHVGAFHPLGSNGIIINRSVLNAVTRGGHSLREINSYVYPILLQEYLHSLEYADEKLVRKLAHQVSLETFGVNHPTTRIVSKSIQSILENANTRDMLPSIIHDCEVIPDLEKSAQRYIS